MKQELKLTQPFYCSSVVHIPGEIVDLPTISNLTKFNHFLVHIKYDFYDGVIQANYIKSLQQEVNQTPAELLAGKLDFMLHREYTSLCNWYNSWYLNTFGVTNPMLVRPPRYLYLEKSHEPVSPEEILRVLPIQTLQES